MVTMALHSFGHISEMVSSLEFLWNDSNYCETCQIAQLWRFWERWKRSKIHNADEILVDTLS